VSGDLGAGVTIQPIAARNGAFLQFQVKEHTPLSLNVGRAAKPGEAYTTAFNAVLPGGVLACSAIENKRVGDVEAQIVRAAPDVEWRLRDPHAGLVSASVSALSDDYINLVSSPDSSHLLVIVTATPTSNMAGTNACAEPLSDR
jgi:hypothetical protein